MGHSLCMQPWIQVAGITNTLVQPTNDWVDLSGYQDVVFYVDVADVTVTAGNTTTLSLQTGPSQDESLLSGGRIPNSATFTFQTAPAVTLGVQPLQVARFYPSVGNVARFLRWSLDFGGVATVITFRIWLNLNPAGW
jgi:hypothetical protein